MAVKSPPYTVVKDTREQNGYTFEKFSGRYTSCKGMVLKKLDTGDYTLLGLEDKLCIERKASVAELAINLGKDKFRFLDEIERMKPFPFKFLILEFSLDDLNRFPDGSDIPQEKWPSVVVSNKYMLKMLVEFQMYNGINVLFCNDKKNAKLMINSILKRVNEHYTVGRKL